MENDSSSFFCRISKVSFNMWILFGFFAMVAGQENSVGLDLEQLHQLPEAITVNLTLESEDGYSETRQVRF